MLLHSEVLIFSLKMCELYIPNVPSQLIAVRIIFHLYNPYIKYWNDKR